MALNEANPSDVDYEVTADLTIDGRSFENQNVYGDKKYPKRRTIIPSSEVRNAYGNNLPKNASVEWMGRRYPAELSFRTRKGGHSVPVYQFFVDSA